MSTKKPANSAKGASAVGATGAGSATGGQGAAKSTKVVTDKGSHVTTVATATTATAGEPENVTLEISAAAAKGDLGFTLKGLSVDKVTKAGLADKRGVRAGWLVVKVGSKTVSSENEVQSGLAAAKKAGKAFNIVFRVSRPVDHKAKDVASASATAEVQPTDTVPTADNGQPSSAVPQEGPAPPHGTTEASPSEEHLKQAAEEAEKARALAEQQAEEERKRAEEQAEAERKAKEEEAAKKQEEDKEEEEARKRRNGMARFKYEMYDQEFPISNGCITQEVIDEEFAFSFVMPNCILHLSETSPTELTALRNQGKDAAFVMERPGGLFLGLETGKAYYCYVEQNADQLKKDQASGAARAAAEAKAGGGGGKKEDGRGFESCSCIYGAPCVDEYGCRDWTNRFAVAKKNGWKGF